MGIQLWTEETSEALRSFINEGLSFAKAAEKLNARFGLNLSRNAAIGRGGRMGLLVKRPKREKVPKVERPKRSCANKHSIVTRIIRGNGNSNHMRVIESRELAEAFELRCVEIIPRNLTLLELEAGDCHYPYGDEAITFCGHPILAGSSYCAPHKHLCLAPSSPHRRVRWRAAA